MEQRVETGLLTTSIAFPVAICPGWQVAYHRLQWVLQRWRAPQWRDRAFCRTRAGLERSIGELIGREHQAAVAHLPDWHPDVDAVPEPKQTPIEVVTNPELRVSEDRPINDFISGPTLGALQGDDYPLEYYEDGTAKIPLCLDRRRKAERLSDAA